MRRVLSLLVLMFAMFCLSQPSDAQGPPGGGGKTWNETFAFQNNATPQITDFSGAITANACGSYDAGFNVTVKGAKDWPYTIELLMEPDGTGEHPLWYTGDSVTTNSGTMGINFGVACGGLNKANIATPTSGWSFFIVMKFGTTVVDQRGPYWQPK